MNELNQLNSDLMQHLQPCHQEEPAPAPIPAPMTRSTKVSFVYLFYNSCINLPLEGWFKMKICFSNIDLRVVYLHNNFTRD